MLTHSPQLTCPNTIESIINICTVFGVNANWMIRNRKWFDNDVVCRWTSNIWIDSWQHEMTNYFEAVKFCAVQLMFFQPSSKMYWQPVHIAKPMPLALWLWLSCQKIVYTLDWRSRTTVSTFAFANRNRFPVNLYNITVVVAIVFQLMFPSPHNNRVMSSVTFNQALLAHTPLRHSGNGDSYTMR